MPKPSGSPPRHTADGYAIVNRSASASSIEDQYAEVPNRAALPPDVPSTPSNQESFDALLDEDDRRVKDARSKTPVSDSLLDCADSRHATPPRVGAMSLAWDPYDSRLASPIEQVREGAQSPVRPRSSTPPIPAWVKQGMADDVIIIDAQTDAMRSASPDFSGRPRSNSTDMFTTSTPVRGISPGRPKPGTSRMSIFKRGKSAKVAPIAMAPPSPLIMGNFSAVTGDQEEEQEQGNAGGGASEAPLYSQVQKHAKPEQISVAPARQDEEAARKQPVPRSDRLPSHKVVEETLAVVVPPVKPEPYKKKKKSKEMSVSVSSDTASTDTATTSGSCANSASDSADPMNETSPYAEVQYQSMGGGRATGSITPTQRQERMPMPTTAKSVTFHSKLTSDYLLAADSRTEMSYDSSTAGQDESDGSVAELTDWAEDPTHLTPLHYASALGKRRYLTLLLKQLKNGICGERSMARLDNMQETTMMRTTNVSKMTDIDCMDGYQRTALMHAVHGGHVDCVRLLAHEGADVNILSSDGSTALHVACFDGNPNMMTLLLHHGADPHLMDNSGRLALHWATAPYGRLCVHAMLKKIPGLDVNALDATQMTPLMWAAHHDSLDVVEELLKQGADRTLRDEDGLSACHWAIHPQDSDTLKLLLDTNSVRARDDRGKTLAHMAAEHGAVESMKLILSCWHQCVHQCDDNGRTPLHWATVCDQPNIIRLLLVAGADASTPDRLGRSPRDYAAIKKLRYCQVLLSQPKAAGSHEMSLAQLDASITGEFTQRWSQWLSDGCTLGKFTNDGRGPLHKRFFWVDIARSEICWSKDKKKKDGSSARVVDIIPGASDAVLSRADYSDRKRHHLTVLTADRSLELVAKNEDDLQCWLQGLRCLIDMKTAAEAAIKP